MTYSFFLIIISFPGSINIFLSFFSLNYVTKTNVRSPPKYVLGDNCFWKNRSEVTIMRMPIIEIAYIVLGPTEPFDRSDSNRF